MPLVHLEVLGMNIDVSGLDETEAAFVSKHWGQCVVPPHTQPIETINRPEGSWGIAYEQLTQRVTNRAITLNVGNYMMFHAAGLQIVGDTQVFAFVAPSGTGKSTLTSALGKKMVYLSDEVVAVDDKLNVLSMQKPISLIGRSSESRKGHIGPEQLGLITEIPNVSKLASILILDRQPEIASPRLSQLALDDALLALASQSSGLGQMKDGLKRMCQIVDKTGPVLKLSYSESSALNPAFFTDHLANRATADTTEWFQVPFEDSIGKSLSFEFARAEYIDAVVIDHCVCILRPGHLIKLGELASEIWLRLPDLASKSELVQRLEEKFGAHENSEPILEHVLMDLELKNLVVRQKTSDDDVQQSS